MAKRQRPFTPDTLDDIYSKLTRVSERVRLIHKTPTVIERINPVILPNPVEGQIAIDARTDCLIYYANEAWREKCSAVHAIKVYGDRIKNKVRDGAFRFTIEKDLDNTEISLVEAFNGTEGSGSTSAQLRNVTRGINILSTLVTVAGGAWHDNGAATVDEGGPILDPNNVVHWKDRMWINLTAVGVGSKGFGMYITHHGPRVNLDDPDEG